jgi:hypothetical protein
MDRVVGLIEYDQWIVRQHFDPYRPFFHVHFKDADKMALYYLSERTGEILQKTLRSERVWIFLAQWFTGYTKRY